MLMLPQHSEHFIQRDIKTMHVYEKQINDITCHD